MSNELVLRTQQGAVVTLTLNQPERRNALSLPLLKQLREYVQQLQSDQSVRVVILKANGPVFSAGHDLKELTSVDAATQREVFKICSEVMEGLRQLPQPVIGQVHALATAAGCQLAASCDLIIAAETASFATPGVKIGLFCTTPAIPLVRSIPPRKALEMLFTGAPISAQESEKWGLVNRVVPADQLDKATDSLVQQLLTSSAATLALGKKAFYEQRHLDFPAAYAAAQQTMATNLQLADCKEGMAAFVAKRQPNWQHK